MAGERVLIVDDEKSMCKYLSIMLKKEGYKVKTVSSGKQAISEIKKAEYDAVMTDIKMKGIDGIEVLSAVKSHKPNLPVIIMTAYASQKTAIDALNKGAFHYMVKRAAKNDEIKMIVHNAVEARRTS
ncbi:MAG TPA: response regulator, partial [Candidatus Krumholzibacteriaceae bacterium]|nr:response regulator [Candidatus Krumholzibacteriaceae bacterium]